MSILKQAISVICKTNNVRLFNTNSISMAGAKWRLAQGLPENGNAQGPLFDIPDWTYADGRPSPLGGNMIRRRKKQQKLVERVVKLMNEMDQSKSTHAAQQQNKQNTKNLILKNKLKSK